MHDRTYTPAEIDRIERDELAALHRAAEIGRTARAGALLVAVLILAAVWAGYMAPVPEAHSAPRATAGTTKTVGGSPVKGEVDVCAVDLGKSWTRGLERKANRALRQRIDVHRRGEDNLRGCDVIVWRSGEISRGAVDPISGELSANPRYFVLVGTPYNIHKVEVNVGPITPRKQRPATIVEALKAAGIR